MFETLENRQLFAATAMVLPTNVAFAGIEAIVIDRTLYVWGNNGIDSLGVKKLKVDRLMVERYVGGSIQTHTRLLVVAAGSVDLIRMEGYGGPDSLYVDKRIKIPAIIHGGA